MPRLNQERQAKLEPERIKKAIEAITDLGFTIHAQTPTAIQFMFQDCMVTYWPYSGWASGSSIQDGRGLDNLLKQLK